MNGLTKGVEYVIWVRMCIESSSVLTKCDLLAQEKTAATRPDRTLNFKVTPWREARYLIPILTFSSFRDNSYG